MGGFVGGDCLEGGVFCVGVVAVGVVEGFGYQKLGLLFVR